MTPLTDLRIMNGGGMVKTVDDVRTMARAPVTDIVVSMTVDEREGNKEPVFWQHPDGTRAYNSVGLKGPGREYYSRHGAKMREKAHEHGKRLIANITSTVGADDWKVLCELASNFCDGIDVNGGCPNFWFKGVQKPIIAHDPAATAKVLDEVKASTNADMPVWFKVSPVEYPQSDPLIQELADAIRSSNRVNALISCNTMPSDAPVYEGRQQISMPRCGMSGPVLKPYSLAMIDRLQHLLPGMPFIGCGGIVSGRDVLDYAARDVIGIQIATHTYVHGIKVLSEVLQQAHELSEAA